MKKTTITLLLLSIWATLPALAQVQISIDSYQKKHIIHPMIQGHGLVYSEEADSIYADGSVAQLYQDIGAGFLRWPGGTVATMYHWNDLSGVGWIDNWNPNYNRSSDADPSDYMDLDEYITLTNAAGTEPMLGINMSSGLEWDREEEALQEALDMIQYCIDQNFDVRYFYLDNETYHHGNGYNKDANGNGGEWTASLYAEQVNIYAAAIKTLVPDAKLIANWTDKVRTNTANYTTIINTCGHNIDYIDVHWYWKWGVATWEAWKEKTPMENETEWYDGGTFVEEIEFFNTLTASLGKPHIKLAALEWNVAPGDYNHNPTHTQFRNTLIQAEMQMQFMQGGIELASMWTTQWKGSSTTDFQALLNSDDKYMPSPSAKMFELYKNAIDGNVVASSAADGHILTTTIIKDNKAYVYLLNKNDNNKNADFNITGHTILSVNEAVRFDDPGEISTIYLWEGTSGNYQATLKANSLTMVVFNLEEEAEQNALINGDFENGLNNWVLWNNPTTSTDAYEGNNAFKMVDKGSAYQWVTVSPSTTYTISAYVKTSDANKKVVLGVANEDNVNITNKDIYDTEYTLQNMMFTTDENTNSVKVWTWLPPSDGATALVDQIVLKRTAYILNPDFEQGLLNWDYYGGTTTETAIPYGGSTSLKIDGTGGSSQFFKTKANTTYEITFYAKVEDPTLSARLHVKNSSGSKYFEQHIYDTEYTQYSISFTTDTNDEDAKIGFWRPKNANGGAWLDNISIQEIESNARLNSINDRFNIKVYPNPSSDYVTISTGNSQGEIEFILYDIMGQSILSDSFFSQHRLDISNLEKGTYILVIKDTFGNDKRVKILVQ
ncbi:carbohydrate binding domain-containing protein [Flammeovirga kamogawensis]|uniref:T9SS type A sorting domain-containing protein n=1 Tax=Flammeovirga kamogawensis TaxID=373891 RepID=A0ABX8H4S3_9BACT|nr:carbohydrate binding domain-containing protein [Flammeovirga kamogawensis]MBB6461783.1 hypothetical protein [Flammeovirga kamogawensis]QWG10699.1 T9SS type A sorting domain-containing protein [Flammeovirga kamogawensis]TRX63801.1 T9SS type A sorting domain-containing protein [Flammeovirga kamogawensis]